MNKISNFLASLTASIFAIFVCALIVAIPVFVYIATCWLITTVLSMVFGLFGAQFVALEAVYMIVFIFMLAVAVDMLGAEKKQTKKLLKKVKKD